MTDEALCRSSKDRPMNFPRFFETLAMYESNLTSLNKQQRKTRETQSRYTANMTNSSTELVAP